MNFMQMPHVREGVREYDIYTYIEPNPANLNFWKNWKFNIVNGNHDILPLLMILTKRFEFIF